MEPSEMVRLCAWALLLVVLLLAGIHYQLRVLGDIKAGVRCAESTARHALWYYRGNRAMVCPAEPGRIFIVTQPGAIDGQPRPIFSMPMDELLEILAAAGYCIESPPEGGN
jgi:hypothetical protein